MADIGIELLNMDLKNPVMPAAGSPVKDAKAASLAVKGGAGAIVTKTISVKGAEVSRPCIAKIEGGMLNSELWSELEPEIWLTEEYPQIKELGLPVIIGLGYSAEEIKTLAPQVAEFADCLELSTHYLGGDTTPVVEAIKAAKSSADLPVLVKLSPQVDIPKFAQAAEEAGADGIVLINSFGPCLDIDINSGKALLGNNYGYGWLSGRAIFPLALRCVFEAAQAVDIPIIGVGGISTGEDAIKMMMAGASAVQICTAAMVKGADIYGRVAQEMADFLEEKGYGSLAEIKGLALTEIKAEKNFKKEEPYVSGDCCQCNICVKVCPYDALVLDDKLEIDSDKCFGCGFCVTICPTEALKWSRR
jgi:dihydroorotate dehydrogenase subfamily 1